MRFTAHTEPGAAAALVGVPRPDAVHDARRGRRGDRRARRHLAPVGERRGPVRRLRARPARPADGVRRGGRARPAACGPSRRCGSRAASRGSASTPTTARSPTRPAGSVRAVHLDKGCYRGQETVARVHTLGRPPRRLTLLHLDGSENRLPPVGAELLARRQGRRLRRHLGPPPRARPDRAGAWSSATCRSTPSSTVDGMPAAQEVLVDPEVGLHVRPLR